MLEREPQPSPPDTSAVEAFDALRFGSVLGSEAQPLRDGYRYDLGPSDAALTLEIYPALRSARLTSRGMQLTLLDIESTRLFDDRIHLASGGQSSERIQLEVTAGGEIGLLLTPGTDPEPAESPESRPTSSRRPDPHGEGSPSKYGPETAPREDPEQTMASASQPDRKESDERVELIGTMLTPPTFKRSPKRERFIAEFELGIQHEDGSSTVERVAVFDARAHQLQNNIESGLIDIGDPLEVIGYAKVRRRGTEIYAVNVRLSE